MWYSGPKCDNFGSLNRAFNRHFAEDARSIRKRNVVWESAGWDVEKVNEYVSFFEQKRIKKEPFLQKEGKAVCVWRALRDSPRRRMRFPPRRPPEKAKQLAFVFGRKRIPLHVVRRTCSLPGADCCSCGTDCRPLISFQNIHRMF